MNWQAVIDVAAWFFLVYFVAMGACQLLLYAFSLLELPRQLEATAGTPATAAREVRAPGIGDHAGLQRRGDDRRRGSLDSAPRISGIRSDRGERRFTQRRARSARREYSLVPFPEAYRRQIESEPVQAVYDRRPIPTCG